jgi:hypothetical protein
MWDPLTNGIHEMRDIVWLQHMYYTRDIGQDIMVPPMVITGIDDPTPNAIREGIGDVGNAGGLPREGMPLVWTIQQHPSKAQPKVTKKVTKKRQPRPDPVQGGQLSP